MNTTELGMAAESAVEEFLIKSGFRILERNWKTSTCEIDIIAKYGDIIHFVEVKYRKRATSGTGFEYITPQKIRRMSYAGQLWATKHNWYGDIVLSGASVEGAGLKIEFTENIFE